jgi:hypothetical protein
LCRTPNLPMLLMMPEQAKAKVLEHCVRPAKR